MSERDQEQTELDQQPEPMPDEPARPRPARRTVWDILDEKGMLEGGWDAPPPDFAPQLGEVHADERPVYDQPGEPYEEAGAPAGEVYAEPEAEAAYVEPEPAYAEEPGPDEPYQWPDEDEADSTWLRQDGPAPPSADQVIPDDEAPHQWPDEDQEEDSVWVRETERPRGQDIAFDGPVTSYHGTLGKLYKVWLPNAIATLLTLSALRFLARTRIRRHLWANFEFLGQRVHYTGTAKELFRSFTVVMILCIAPISLVTGFAIFWAVLEAPEVIPLILAALVPVLAFLWPAARYRARRYRLMHTQWRGVRGAQSGSALTYSILGFLAFVINIVSLGLLLPWTDYRLAAYRTNHTWFGNQRLRFYPALKPLFQNWLLIWLVNLVALGAAGMAGYLIFDAISALGPIPTQSTKAYQTNLYLSSLKATMTDAWPLLLAIVGTGLLGLIAFIFYQAARIQCFAAGTLLDGVHFRADGVTGSGLMRMKVGSWLILIFTLGLAKPLVIHSWCRYWARHLQAQGILSAGATGQPPSPPLDTKEHLIGVLGSGEI